MPCWARTSARGSSALPGREASEQLEGELRQFCAERLSDYKVPRRFTFVDELPRNATGKVVKRELPGRS